MRSNCTRSTNSWRWGYYRGIVRKLDEIEALDASHTGFVNHMHTLARQYQLDAMTRIIRQGFAVG